VGFRGAADTSQNSTREIPRGPKADSLRHTGPPTPRGRGGFAPRADFRDREVLSPFRRDNDRPDWPRRDREFPANDRDSLPTRDTRPFHPRERSMSPNRIRRDLKETPPTAPRISDPVPAWHVSGGRGASLRARGRTDWDRGRSRPLVAERDGFGPRSRSREGWRDRDRDWERSEIDHRERFDRRDHERSLERDDRERETTRWRHDRSPSRNSTGNQATGPSRLSTAPSLTPAHTLIAEPARRFSTALTLPDSGREAPRDTDKGDYYSANIDPPAMEIKTRRALTPPYPPTVPPFGSSLDYVKPVKTYSTGASTDPAPPAKTTATASQSLRPIEKPAVAGQDALFQPPTGPKADRTNLAVPLTYKESKVHAIDLRAKPETHTRPMRAATSSTLMSQATSVIGLPRNESWESIAGAGAESKNIPHKQLTPKPVGPSMLSALSSKRLDPTPSKNLPPKTPPAIPTGPAAMEASPTAPRSNIPTGPRIQPKQYPHARNVPGYKVPTAPARPSIMNSAPLKPPQAIQRERNYGLPTIHRKIVDPFVIQNIKPRMVHKQVEQDRSPTNWRREDVARMPLGKIAPSHEPETSMKDDSLLPISIGPSTDDGADDDDDGLDEEDFVDSERKYKKEMDILTAKRPPSPLHDPTIVGLLIRIQLLGMIADGSVPAGIEADEKMEEVEIEKATKAVGLPSPAVEDGREESPPPTGRFLKDPPYNPIPTPPIEDLPFLSSAVLQGENVFDSSDEDDDMQGRIVASLCEEFSLQDHETDKHCMQLKEEFSKLYRPWRSAVSNMDRREREENPLTPAPASPPLSLVPTAAPTPLVERTRGAKNTTELDFQNILRASEQSAREEQERRDRELTARPNYEMEAVIPDMLERKEIEMSFFEDRNQLVPEENALDMFAFVPPQDDFSPGEQKAFIAAFNSHPKKWSEIAECLPGRNFQQCILHYYLTKHSAKYKELYRKTLPKKKRGRAPAVRPRSTALMSDLVYEREEVDSTPTAVTDSGRPRRAAAPTFGEPATDPENAVAPATVSRRVTKESNGEQSAEKSTGRKRGGAKAPRKTKVAAGLAAGPAAGPSPQKVEKEIKSAKVIGKPDAPVPKVDEPFLSDLQRGNPGDVEQSRPATQLSTSTLDGATPARPLTAARSVSQQSSSYWSVPETHYFPKLIEYFGTDWAGISTFMETKTSNMVSMSPVPALFKQSLVNYGTGQEPLYT
jgi:Myb-like DNA-binding domain